MMEFRTIRRALLVVASLFLHFVSTSRLEFEDFIANTCAISRDDLVKINTSYRGCIHHCKDMSDCAAVSHKQKASLCRLNFGEFATRTCQGYFHSQKASWEMNTSSKCSCPAGHRCELNGDCVPSMCDDLDSPKHGRMFGNQLSVGDKITFLCNHGYLLHGNNQRVCTSSGKWRGRDVTCTEDPACNNYLVSGSGGVEDDQLTESSYWCQNAISVCTTRHHHRDGMSAKYARINSTGLITGSWTPASSNPNEYIQVNFKESRTISAIVLQGRDPGPLGKDEYVQKFKVLHSFECVHFKVIRAVYGKKMIFEGNSKGDEIVIRKLPEYTRAKCIRLNPIAWHGYLSLRFDILGC